MATWPGLRAWQVPLRAPSMPGLPFLLWCVFLSPSMSLSLVAISSYGLEFLQFVYVLVSWYADSMVRAWLVGYWQLCVSTDDSTGFCLPACRLDQMSQLGRCVLLHQCHPWQYSIQLELCIAKTLSTPITEWQVQNQIWTTAPAAREHRLTSLGKICVLTRVCASILVRQSLCKPTANSNSKWLLATIWLLRFEPLIS